MYAANAYTIRLATEDDARALRLLAERDSEPRPLTGRVLVGEGAGAPAAAISIDENRVVADPFRPTGLIVAHLRRRASALRAADAEPSLRKRIRAGISARASEPGAGPALAVCDRPVADREGLAYGPAVGCVSQASS